MHLIPDLINALLIKIYKIKEQLKNAKNQKKEPFIVMIKIYNTKKELNLELNNYPLLDKFQILLILN